jgi:hypothetical protein
VRLATCRIDQGFSDPRPADPGLAAEQDHLHLTFTGLGVPSELDHKRSS